MEKDDNGKIPPPEERSFQKDSGTSDGSEPLTLLRRSQRVLGDIDLDESSIPLSSASSHSEPATSKRREQVRKAQRTHRQRTQAYIKELEKEVLRLRNAESEALARVSALEQQVTGLLTTLTEHNISFPPPTEPPQASGWMSNVALATQDNPSAASVSLTTPSAADMSSIFTPVLGRTQHLGALVNPSAGLQSENMSQSLLQDPRVGIEFVLALERLCLDHLRNSHLDYDDRAENPGEQAQDISHHIFTASLQLWQPNIRSRSAQESYEISVSEIERLLRTSLNIGVKDDEITPVQIWNHLKEFKLPEDMQRVILSSLTEELCKHVECLYYGATIKLTTLNRVLSEYIPEAVMTA